MFAKTYTEYCTLEDREHWQDPWELIYGSPYPMASSPLVTHQHINGKYF